MNEYKELETRFAKFAGSKYSVSCNTGTASLHLALLALGIGAGDEVIVPDFTMASCAFAVSYCRATPIFVDVETDTFGIDPSLIEEKITKKTRAIMVVHVYGRLAKMEKILEIAKFHGLPVIEDASEAHGAVKNSEADITCYSLYKNKIIHAEEGGICTTNVKYYADRMNFLKNMAFTEEHDFYHPEIGFNYRMPDSQARLALMSLEDYPKNAQKRRDIERWYDSFFESTLPDRDAVWFYDVVLPRKDEMFHDLGVRLPFKPLSSLPMYNQGVGRVSSALSESLLLLPCNPELTHGEIEYITKKLNESTE